MHPSGRNRLGRLLRLPLRLVPAQSTLRVLFGPLAGARWISNAGTHGCWIGSYERDLQRDLASSLREGDVFFDVGANAGFFSLLASRLVGASGRVIAFEPLPRNLDVLRRHVALNHLQNVTVVPAAVADAAGTGFLTEAQSASQASLGSHGVAVQIVALDDLVAAGTIPDPSVLKIDVEGAESRVLVGARAVLSKASPRIYLSTHGFQQHQACWSLLAEAGYELRLRCDGSADGQYESVAVRASRAV